MRGTIIARTQSGSTYVLTLEGAGVRWVRVPAPGRMQLAATGSMPLIPRIVPGERLFLGDLRTSPIEEVAFLPDMAPSVATEAEAAAAFH
jgi:hypothetical protein